MLVAVVVSVLGLAVVLLAYYREEPATARAAVGPRWEGLPAPADLTRVEFPLAFPGYEPAAVEAHLDAVADAYGDLLAVAPAEVRARAHRRIGLRTGAGMEHPAEGSGAAEGVGASARARRARRAGDVESGAVATSALTDLGQPPDEHEERLRTEAALAAIDQLRADSARPPEDQARPDGRGPDGRGADLPQI